MKRNREGEMLAVDRQGVFQGTPFQGCPMALTNRILAQTANRFRSVFSASVKIRLASM